MSFSSPENSTTVRFETKPPPSGPVPKLITGALRLAPFLQQPVLTRLFLTPLRPKKRPAPQAGRLLGRVRIAEREILVRARGSGPAVLLVHGWQGSSAHVHSLGTALAASGFTAISFDMPAHGETKGNTTSIAEFIEAIFEVAELVGPLHAVVAHSLGATAAALAIDRGLAVQAAALIAPMVSFDFALDEFSKMLGLDSTLREKTARGAEARLGLSRQEADLRTINIGHRPLLLVHDENDTRTPPGYTDQLHELWSGSHLLQTEGLGHRRILDDLSTVKQIAEFVSAVPSRATEPMDFQLVPELTL